MRNKILCLAVVLLSSLSVFAQRPVNYTKLFHRYNYISMKADSALMLPLYDGAPVGVRGGETIRSGYIAIDSTNNVLYFYSDSAWRTVSGVNIYNSDGTLTGNRVLTGDAYSLTFTGLSSFVTAIGSTTRLSLNSTTSTMQSPDALNYFQTDNSSATMASENNYLKLYDTYVEIDTLEKGSLTDSVMVYSPSTGRVKFMDPVLLGGKVSYSDTTSMLANYLVTAGDLSPIFTTTESGHNIEFDLSNTTQYTVLGRTASGSGDPSYVSIDTTFISSFYTKVRSLFTAGTGITITNGQITSTVTGGTVTSLTASDANGFDFTITDPTTAPNISLTTSVTDTRVIYSNSGAVAGVSGFTSDGTNVTAGSNNLRATSPRITTGINDANGNELFLFTATGSAVNEMTVANAATGADPTITASGGDSNVGFNIVTKGTGAINFKGNSTQAAEIRLYEDTDNGTDYTSFKVGSQSLNVQYTLPTGYAAVNGYVLSSTTGGVMSWVAPATGTVTDFSAGDLSPLFTTSEATTTTTPALTFSLSNTTQYTVFGRSASGSGAPSYISIDTTFISSFSTKVRSLFSAGTGMSYNSATGQFSSISRFGVSGEDASAAQTRSFDHSTYYFGINNNSGSYAALEVTNLGSYYGLIANSVSSYAGWFSSQSGPSVMMSGTSGADISVITNSSSILPALTIKKTSSMVASIGSGLSIVTTARNSASAYDTTMVLQYSILSNGSSTFTSHVDILGKDTAVQKRFLNIQPDGIVRTNNDADTLATRAYSRSLLSPIPRYVPKSDSTASTSSLTVNSDNIDIYIITALAADLTINAPTGTLYHGKRLILQIEDNGTKRNLTFNSVFAGRDIPLPTETIANKVLTLGFYYDDNNDKWVLLAYDAGG